MAELSRLLRIAQISFHSEGMMQRTNMAGVLTLLISFVAFDAAPVRAAGGWRYNSTAKRWEAPRYVWHWYWPHGYFVRHYVMPGPRYARQVPHWADSHHIILGVQ
jgi:hypothetical protein